MFRVFSLAVVVAVMQSAFCDFAFADPDHTIVRLAIDKEDSSVAVSGQSRVRRLPAWRYRPLAVTLNGDEAHNSVSRCPIS